MSNSIFLDLNMVHERANELAVWLTQNGNGCFEEQAHLDTNTSERVYWHYGYIIALQDVLTFLQSNHDDVYH